MIGPGGGGFSRRRPGRDRASERRGRPRRSGPGRAARAWAAPGSHRPQGASGPGHGLPEGESSRPPLGRGAGKRPPPPPTCVHGGGRAEGCGRCRPHRHIRPGAALRGCWRERGAHPMGAQLAAGLRGGWLPAALVTVRCAARLPPRTGGCHFAVRRGDAERVEASGRQRS